LLFDYISTTKISYNESCDFFKYIIETYKIKTARFNRAVYFYI